MGNFLKKYSWADLRPFIGQVQEILTLVNVMEGSNLMPQLAKKRNLFIQIFFLTHMRTQ